MMEEKLNSMATPDFVEIEHHCGGVSIFDKEKPYRLNSRGIILEKIGLTLSDFIQDSSRYSELCKKTSFGNLSLLLNEIFHQGLDIASQTYSPLILEQLTQDQQLGETYNLIKALFEQELKEELNLRGCINIEQLFSRLIARNFDFDHEQYFLKGVSFFLFTKVARLFSENFSYYSLMEKLLGNIFKKNPIVFIEFQLFLYILKTKEQGEVYDEIYKMRGVFQTLQYEKLSEIFIRSMSHVDDSTKLINDTLKFLYLQTKSSQFITLTIFFSDLVSNESPVNAQACILFLIKVLNVNIACKFEMENLDNQSQLFSQQFQPVMNKCLNGSGNIQANFWNFHRIMTQNYTKTNIIEETITNVASLMNGKVGMNLDTRSYMNFLYNFRNFFQSIFFLCEDEKVLIDSVSSLLDISICYKEIVYLCTKGIKAKLQQKCLRLYLQKNSANKDKINNLLENFLFWKEKNLISIGNDSAKFSVDYLIQKQCETLIQDLSLNKKLFEQLFNA